jgi:CRISPR-associated protein Csb2
MPTPGGPKLVLDAFLRVSPDEDLVAIWLETTLTPELFALASHLAERLGYLGRAESIVIARSLVHLASDLQINCLPGPSLQPGSVSVEVLGSLPAEAYRSLRADLLQLNSDRPRSKKRLAFEATLPETLVEAIQVDTPALQAVGWSSPPAGRHVLYHRPEVGARAPTRRDRVKLPSPLPTIARLVLAGRPLPRIEDTVKIGETFRLAVMGLIKGDVPPAISGRDATGMPSRNPHHRHAFFLAEDVDDDGLIDHLVLSVSDGLAEPARTALDRLRRLWIAGPRSADAEDEPERGRKEWRVALEGFGDPADFPDCSLLRACDRWESVTPYLRSWHLKTRDLEVETLEMVREECRRREIPLRLAEPLKHGRSIAVHGNQINVLRFYRFRSRRGLIQPDRSGAALLLTFEQPVFGPIALGFGCHFGLGLFANAGSKGAARGSN